MNKNYWKDIPRPKLGKKGFSSILNPFVECPISFLFTKDDFGNIGFGIKSNIELKNKKPKSLEIIDIFWKNKTLKDNNSEVYFILNQSKYEKEFQHFCTDIIKNCENLGHNEDSKAIKIMLEVLERWKNLFKAKRVLLSDREQMGLYGELVFIRDYLQLNIGIKNAILSWEDGEQDFEFNGKLFEIKSQNAASDSKIMISSLQQLDTSSGNIFLIRQKIGKKNNVSENSESLNGTILSIIELIKKENDSLLLEKFELSLFERNYLIENDDSNRNYTTKYNLMERIFYEITESFPSITPNKVDIGILKASYEISEITIEQFTKKSDDIAKSLKRLVNE